jgi:hypothetical protein
LGDNLAIEGKSPADLVQLALAGGRLELDARRYSVQDLITIARALRPECLMTIANSEGKSTSELVSIVAAAPGRVVVA